MKYIKLAFEILSESKKVRALVVGLLLLALVPLGKRVGVELDEDAVNKALALIGAFIIGQGIADHGKEAKKIEAQVEAAKLPDGTRPKWL
jgi:hypothetical protein